MKEFKAIMKNIIKEQIGSETKIGLLFSGGTDSLTCLFALLELDIEPMLYTFRRESVIHTDVIISQKVAQHYGLNHKIIVIKEDINQLQLDVVNLIKSYRIYRKTNVQCTYPFYHVLPEVEESIIVTGLCADDLYGTSKSMSIKFKDDKTGFDKKRKDIFASVDSSAYRSIKELVEVTHNKKLIAPYRDTLLIDYLMQFSWRQLNTPKQKIIAVDAFQKYFDELNVYRRNTNLQVGSKIREWHDGLIKTDLNKSGYNRVDEIYKQIYREMVQCSN